MIPHRHDDVQGIDQRDKLVEGTNPLCDHALPASGRGARSHEGPDLLDDAGVDAQLGREQPNAIPARHEPVGERCEGPDVPAVHLGVALGPVPVVEDRHRVDAHDPGACPDGVGGDVVARQAEDQVGNDWMLPGEAELQNALPRVDIAIRAVVRQPERSLDEELAEPRPQWPRAEAEERHLRSGGACE